MNAMSPDLESKPMRLVKYKQLTVQIRRASQSVQCSRVTHRFVMLPHRGKVLQVLCA